MGLFDSLFARAAAGLVRESKAQQKKTQSVVSVLNELNAYQRIIDDFVYGSIRMKDGIDIINVKFFLPDRHIAGHEHDDTAVDGFQHDQLFPVIIVAHLIDGGRRKAVHRMTIVIAFADNDGLAENELQASKDSTAQGSGTGDGNGLGHGMNLYFLPVQPIAQRSLCTYF